MGGQHSTPASKLSSLRRAIRSNQEDLSEVELSGVELTDKAVGKLTEAFKNNK